MVTRIRQLLEQKQLTPTQFADAIGVGRPVMSHILSERNKPSLEVVQRIIDAFPEVSMPWLLRGTGEMLESGSAPAEEAANPPTKPTEAALAASAPIVSQAESEPEALPVPPVTAPVTSPLATTPAVPSSETEAAATSEASLSPVAAITTMPAQPEASPAPSPVAEAPTLATLKPFKAQRFVPASPLLTQAPATLPTSPLASAAPVVPNAAPAAVVAPPIAPAPVAAPVPFVPAPLPEASPAAITSPVPAVPATTSPEAALLPFLGESGKSIRRIVIFYRDGSFADYQPEQ